MHHDVPIVLVKGAFMNSNTQSGVSHGSQRAAQKHALAGRGGSDQPGGREDREDFQALYEESFQDIREGHIITGEVVKVEKGIVFVDIGYKSEGEVSMSEFRDSEGNVTVKQGDRVEVVLVRKADEKGYPVLSRARIDDVRRRKTIEEAFHKGRPVRGKIISPVKGGYTVDIGLRAFLPGSQVDIFPSKGPGEWTGTEHEFKILSYDRKEDNIVVSRKALLEKEREHQRTQTLKQIQEGAILKGVIRRIMDYGLLVDLGAVLGLVHVTNVSWGKTRNLAKSFKIGDEVSVKVLSYTPDKERISLGMKQLLPDPWPEIEKKYPVGAKVEAPVVALKKYGAFVELEEGIEALIPITGLSGTPNIVHPSQVLNVGDQVEAVVTGVDSEKRQISLSIKDLS
jgi:small subunit ribosomal protein S1